MASISTSALRGSSFTTTQVRLFKHKRSEVDSSAWPFNTYRLDILDNEPAIHFVDTAVELNIGKIDVDFNSVS